jgi:hypothetical protein
VLQPHVAKKLAYTQPKEVETLRAAGVRIAGVEQLAAIILAWVEQEDEQTGGSPRGKMQQMAAPLQMARHPGGGSNTRGSTRCTNSVCLTWPRPVFFVPREKAMCNMSPYLLDYRSTARRVPLGVGLERRSTGRGPPSMQTTRPNH